MPNAIVSVFDMKALIAGRGAAVGSGDRPGSSTITMLARNN